MLLENDTLSSLKVTGSVPQEDFEHAKMQTMGNLAAGIVHEINTPIQYITDNLNFLSSQIDALDSLLEVYTRRTETIGENEIRTLAQSSDADFLREELPAAIQESIAGIRHVAKLVDAVRAFSHKGGSKRIFDVNRGIELMTVISRNEWKSCSEVETDLAPDLPKISGSETQLSQVWLNLIINAAHAIATAPPPGSIEFGRIKVRSAIVDGVVEVSVADNGPGIEEAIQPRVFERFFTTKPKGVGTGQGLAICQRIIHAHDGSIEMVSAPQTGTKFIVRLPAAMDEDMMDEEV